MTYPRHEAKPTRTQLAILALLSIMGAVEAWYWISMGAG